MSANVLKAKRNHGIQRTKKTTGPTNTKHQTSMLIRHLAPKSRQYSFIAKCLLASLSAPERGQVLLLRIANTARPRKYCRREPTARAATPLRRMRTQDTLAGFDTGIIYYHNLWVANRLPDSPCGGAKTDTSFLFSNASLCLCAWSQWNPPVRAGTGTIETPFELVWDCAEALEFLEAATIQPTPSQYAKT